MAGELWTRSREEDVDGIVRGAQGSALARLTTNTSVFLVGSVQSSSLTQVIVARFTREHAPAAARSFVDG